MSTLNKRKYLFLDEFSLDVFLIFLFLHYVFNYQYSLVFHLPQKLLTFLGHVLFRHPNCFLVEAKLAPSDRKP